MVHWASSPIFSIGIFTASICWISVCCDGGIHPGGAECKDNSDCYSHVCSLNGLCAPDGPMEGTVSGGGPCSTNSECFSNYCVERICAADSPLRGKVAGGGFCIQSEQCYSGTCLRRRCGPDSPVPGKMAAGGECEYNTQCYSGSCFYQRCSPDGSLQGRGPGGGYCNTNGQCISGACINQQCSPESHTELNRVADGGRCYADENCQSISRCFSQLCTPKENRNGGDVQQVSGTIVSDTKSPPGSYCARLTDCQTACIFGRCAVSSRIDPSTIADGGMCDQQPTLQGFCKSGQCVHNICAASHSDQVLRSATAAGAPCTNDHLCYSGHCASGRCSSDSAATLNRQASPSHRGQVPGGGLCTDDRHCYSGYCELRTMCGPDGPKRGTLASGAVCTTDSQCYSRYCLNRKCVAAAASGVTHSYENGGKVAPGGRCAYSDGCSSAAACIDNHCKATDPRGDSVLSNILFSRPVLGSVDWNGSCWHNAQCKVGLCLEHQCTVPWYLVDRYSSSPSVHHRHSGRIAMIVFAAALARLL